MKDFESEVLYHAQNLSKEGKRLIQLFTISHFNLLDLINKDKQVGTGQGSRTTDSHREFSKELTPATPRHRDTLFEIVHIDHTELNLQVIDSQTGKNLGRL